MEHKKRFSFQSRKEMWETLDKEEFDLLVIGGGITGTGIAREGAYRGLKVALLEKSDFAAGTSSKSSKLVHGGLRYLEHYEFALVFESLQERHKLMTKVAPHLVQPLPFIIPVWHSSPYGMFMTKLGMLFYDILALFRNVNNHRKLSIAKIQELEPTLETHAIKGGFLYYDGQTDDCRLTLETALSAFEQSATILNYVEVEDFLFQQEKIKGVEVQDTCTKERKKIFAKVVVNATGAFSHHILSKLKSFSGAILRPTKGVHIVFKKEDCPFSHAITFPSAVDERIMFVIPWGDFTIIGTTDTDGEMKKEEDVATWEDVQYILKSIQFLGKNLTFSPEKIVSSYAGWRPLVMEKKGKSESQISRKHKMIHHKENLITMVGGKLTTYRCMAKEVVDYVVSTFDLSTSSNSFKDQPLPGSEEQYDPQDKSHLSQTYGARSILVKEFLKEPSSREKIDPHLPYQKGEIAYLVHCEMAITLQDVLLRRTKIALQSSDFGQKSAVKIAEIMALELGWSEKQKKNELEEFYHLSKANLHWKKQAGLTEK